MFYDVYLRQGRETVHMYRFRGHGDIGRVNVTFQALIENSYGATHRPWDRVAIFPVPGERGRVFLRINLVDESGTK